MTPKETLTKSNVWLPIAIVLISISAALGWALVDALRAGLRKSAEQFQPLVSVNEDTYWPLVVARLLDGTPNVDGSGLRDWLQTPTHLVACVYDLEAERASGPLLAAARKRGLRPALVVRTGQCGSDAAIQRENARLLQIVALCDDLCIDVAWARGPEVARLQLIKHHWREGGKP